MNHLDVVVKMLKDSNIKFSEWESEDGEKIYIHFPVKDRPNMYKSFDFDKEGNFKDISIVYQEAI